MIQEVVGEQRLIILPEKTLFLPELKTANFLLSNIIVLFAGIIKLLSICRGVLSVVVANEQEGKNESNY